MAKFNGKYRIRSNRLPGWDYANNAVYFITIVTQDRICNLGKIEDGKMILSDFGKIVKNEWHKSFQIRSELFLVEFVIMPNHLHAVLILDQSKNKINGNDEINENIEINGNIEINENDEINGNDEINENDEIGVKTNGHSSLHQFQSKPIDENQFQSKPIDENQFQSKPIDEHQFRNSIIKPQSPKSISSFVAGFKSAVNSKIDDYIDNNRMDIPKYNRKNHFFQPNYHDSIVWDNGSLQNVLKYIIDNPKNWAYDIFNQR